MRLLSFGRQHPPPFAPGTQLCLTHQSRYSFAGDASPLIAQLPVDARTAVSPLMQLKHLPNLLRDMGIFSLMLAGRTLPPGIIATFGHFEHTTHDHHGKFVLVLFNKLIFHLDSREKMPRTFFSIS